MGRGQQSAPGINRAPNRRRFVIHAKHQLNIVAPRDIMGPHPTVRPDAPGVRRSMVWPAHLRVAMAPPSHRVIWQPAPHSAIPPAVAAMTATVIIAIKKSPTGDFICLFYCAAPGKNRAAFGPTHPHVRGRALRWGATDAGPCHRRVRSTVFPHPFHPLRQSTRPASAPAISPSHTSRTVPT